MDFSRGAEGFIGPRREWIIAAPRDQGGSGGSFSFIVYNMHAGKRHALQEIATPGDGAFVRLRIFGGKLYARFNSYKYGGADCCPRGYGIAIYDDRKGPIELISSSIHRNP